MRMTIGKKLYGAFGAVVLIMLVMVGVSLRAGTKAETGLGGLSEMMSNSDVVGETFQGTLLMRLAFGDYLLTGTPASFQAFEKNLANVEADVSNARESFTDPDRAAAAQQAGEAVAAFSSAARDIQGILTQQAEVVEKRLNVIGPRLTERVWSHQAAKLKAANLEALNTAIALADDVMLMRLTEVQYLRSKSESDLQRVLAASSEAHKNLRTMQLVESEPAALALLGDIERDLNAYTDAFQVMGNLANQQMKLVDERLDPAVERIAAARVLITESILEDSTALRDEVSNDLATSRTQTITAACIAVAVAVALSFIVSRGISGPIRVFLERFDLIAKGDFTQRVEAKTKDEIGDLASGFNKLVSEIASLIGGVQSTAEQVAAAATEVAATSEQMASSSDHQRAQLTQVAAAVEEMAATVTEVSGRTGEVSRQSVEAGQQATDGGQIVRRTVEEMGQIASQVESTSNAVSQLSLKAVQIGEILTVINDIADQTNLLALNAAIEAARAGEHGRGFAVVADEVRKLAERTQEATREVSTSVTQIQESTTEATTMMDASRTRVSGGVELAQQAGHSLESIVRGSTTVASSVDSIAAAVEQQSATSAEIARSIEVISAAADESTQGANQAAAAATQLSGNAEALRELVSRFRV